MANVAMQPMRVGLLGLGTVGRGTWTVLNRNAEEISRRAGPSSISAWIREPEPAGPTSSSSRRALGEDDRASIATASSRFVLPCPLAPMKTLTPGPGARSSWT